MSETRAYRGVLIARCPRRWHAVVLMRWPRDCAHALWHRRAGVETGLGGYGRGYGTLRELEAAIDAAISRCGEPPPGPVLPEL